MNKEEMYDHLLQMIIEKANYQTHREDGEESTEGYFDPQDASGGNFDDAFDMGTEDGEIEYARHLLNTINKNLETNQS